MQDHLVNLENEYKVSVGNINEKFLKIKSISGGNFIIKLRPENGEDYWVFNHYKMTDIKDMEPSQR